MTGLGFASNRSFEAASAAARDSLRIGHPVGVMKVNVQAEPANELGCPEASTRMPEPGSMHAPGGPELAGPLYRNVVDRLGADIRAGVLPLGAALPSEKEIGALFGVSRITVRRAMDELAQAGLIDRGAGRAARVAAPRLVHAVAAFEDPFGTLQMVRETTIRLLAFEWQVAAGPVARALQLDEGDQMLRIERVRSRGAEPVFHTDAYLPARLGALVNRAALAGSALHDVLAAAGCVPASADRQMSAAPCPRAIARPLDLAPGAPTFRVERISRDAEGRPMHLLIGHWRWDRFSMRLASDSSAAGGLLTIDEPATARPLTGYGAAPHP